MKQIIPVFFACDDNYAPLLGTAIKSMLINASKNYFYNVHVLCTGFNEINTKKLSALQDEKSNIIFENMSDVLKTYGPRLHLRNYYSAATYYRLFIANIFAQYDKALYFDSDMIFLGDISKLYAIDLGDDLVAAAQENVMQEDIFGYYVEKVLDVPRRDFFNAGMLVMNLKALREENIESKFLDLIARRTFSVTQDEDYLNVLCKDRVYKLGYEWNYMPIEGLCAKKPQIVHFKITLRPWKYDGVLYARQFWKFAKLAGYYDELRRVYDNFTPQDRLSDMLMCRNLALMALRQAKEADNTVPLDEKGFIGIHATQFAV